MCRACCLRQDAEPAPLAAETPAPERVARTWSTTPRRLPRRRVGVVAVAAVLVLAIVGGAIAVTRPRSDTGGVAGLTARSTPSAPAPTASLDPNLTGGVTPTATPGTAVTPSPSPDPTARPGTPADLRVTSSAIRPWVDELGELRAQVLVGVTNRGGLPGYLPSAASAWEVRSPDAFAVSQGRFAHVFPRLVEPGGTAWLVDALSATFTAPGDLRELVVTLDAREATPEDLGERGELTVDDVEWRVDATGTLTVSGVVENTGSRTIERWSAGVVLLAADGSPLAAAYEIGEVDPLAPGSTASFSTSYPGSAPVEDDEVASVVARAVPLD